MPQRVPRKRMQARVVAAPQWMGPIAARLRVPIASPEGADDP